MMLMHTRVSVMPSRVLNADVNEESGRRERGSVLGQQVDVAVPCGKGSGPSERGCNSILFFPPHSPPPTLLQAVERQCELAHKVIGRGGIVVFYHEPDQHQLWSPQLELQGLPPAGVEA